MRLLLVPAIAIAMAAPASAQWLGFGGTLDTPYTPMIGLEPVSITGNIVTPTMKRQKIAAADKLRAEVQMMLARNDGDLSQTQIAYIRKQVRRIRGD
ncbi:hypothetical protein [Sphingomonas phyllosphaerae]|uniref:hypothetical protein n=1 Tax=Sphingomonas phyllosphaerae TaxID=257003 RepID=UPI0003B65264|nr:hypothetical protein [Sphingomonas phyllosphaerae]